MLNEIISATRLLYGDALTLKKSLDEKISPDSYSRWCQIIEGLKNSTELNVINTSSAGLPCNSCTNVIKAINESIIVERSVVLKESILHPYWSLYGFFGCIEVHNKEKIRHKNSLILGEVGEYGLYMRRIKEVLPGLLGYKPVFVDVVETANEAMPLKNQINYVGNNSTLYNHLFGTLNLEEYNVIKQ